MPWGKGERTSENMTKLVKFSYKTGRDRLSPVQGMKKTAQMMPSGQSFLLDF
jgi:hypothetical protein